MIHPVLFNSGTCAKIAAITMCGICLATPQPLSAFCSIVPRIDILCPPQNPCGATALLARSNHGRLHKTLCKFRDRGGQCTCCAHRASRCHLCSQPPAVPPSSKRSSCPEVGCEVVLLKGFLATANFCSYETVEKKMMKISVFCVLLLSRSLLAAK